ncbi:MAG: family 43 glycosylhydrolase [Nonomuraea sp.]|nr:family 43 glycosylhydrolase [Nonomuraea sp.]
MGLKSRAAVISAVLSLLTSLAYGSPAEGAERLDSLRDLPVVQTFRNPLNPSADPSLLYHDGSYYLATTTGDHIGIWTAASLATLLAAPEHVVWRDGDSSRDTQMWAPAFRQVGSRWYIYYTASDGVDANHRMYVLESVGNDPMGPYSFKAKIADFGEYAIDGEPITHNGRSYFVWSGPGRGQGGPAQLYIARMSDPWTVTGGRTAIPADGGCGEVREGPTPLYRNGRTFLTYSTCDTAKPDYQLWMTSIADGADPMVESSWVQHPGPVFRRDDAAGVWGPGHHSFFRSPDGTEDWIAYHGKNTSAYTYSFRTTRAQKFGWNADGTPDFGRPLPAGTTQRLPSGDPGAPTAVINDVDVGTGQNQVQYAGTWQSGSGCGNQCFQGDDHWSGRAGATATIRFTGTRVALLSVRDWGNGIAAMSIDGGSEERLDYYSGIRVGEELNYLSPVLPPGPHTLRVRVTGSRNPDSGSTVISLDRIEVYGG